MLCDIELIVYHLVLLKKLIQITGASVSVCAVWRTLVCGQFKCFYFENTCKTISAKDPLQFVESVKVNLCVFSQVSFFCQHVYICGYKFRAKNIWDLNLMIPKCGLFVRKAFCHKLQRNYF